MTTITSTEPRQPVEVAATDTEQLKTSLSVILQSKDDKKEESTLNLNKRVNEEDLYAALIHQQLMNSKPEAAASFEKDFPVELAARRRREKQPSAFKAADQVMRTYIRKGTISQAEYMQFRDVAFGKAQLDSDRTWLSTKRSTAQKAGDTPVRSIATALRKCPANPAATSQEIAVFRAHIAQISREKWRERKIVEETGGIPPDTQALTSAPEGFAWKPQSDSDGKGVVLLPPEWSGTVQSVRLVSSDGTKRIEEGRYTGIGSDQRLHYRFNQPGASYEVNALLLVRFKDQSSVSLRIETPGEGIGEGWKAPYFTYL